MKVKVNKEIVDKYSGRRMSTGDVVEYSEKRITEILSGHPDLITVLQEQEEPEVKKTRRRRKVEA